MMGKTERMKELVGILDQAARAYYAEDREIMSNLEYDKLYDELSALEAKTGIVLAGSPTAHVGYEAVDSLPKETHEERMLSLDKTKDMETLKEWLGDHEGILSWKLDGLTVVLSYGGGQLLKAVTRGNGDTGEVITANAKVFRNIPLTIPFKGQLTLRGEAVIRYSDFQEINEKIQDTDAKYKNPRNLCSGSVRQLNNEITAERNVRFYAFALVKIQEGQGEYARQTEEDGKRGGLLVSRKTQMEWLKSHGFDMVEYQMVQKDTIESAVSRFSERAVQNDLPADGLVLTFDDIAYGKSLGSTSKFPRDAIAFKWQDELKETKLRQIEWSASRTGLINPIAIFDPVELEGTTVSRASVHNLSILKELKLGIGDTVTVYKANMIIPQIAENLTASGTVEIPGECPVCGGETDIKSENGVETLHCISEDCLAKRVKSFSHFVSRDAMNMEGLSEATIEKLIAIGVLKEPAGLFRLSEHEGEILSLEGFGERSYKNLLAAVDKARNTTPARLLYAIGIPNIGTSNAKAICQACANQWEKIQNLTEEDLAGMYGIGDVMARSYVQFFNQEKNRKMIANILQEVNFDAALATAADDSSQALAGKSFVITGSLSHYESRSALIEIIEKNGGKVMSSVSAKTGYLINNDNTSGSSKNKKAKELGVSIITEEQIRDWIENREGSGETC